MGIQNLLAILLDLGCVAYPPCNSSFGRSKNENFELLKKLFSGHQNVKVYTVLKSIFDGESEFICLLIESWLWTSCPPNVFEKFFFIFLQHYL